MKVPVPHRGSATARARSSRTPTRPGDGWPASPWTACLETLRRLQQSASPEFGDNHLTYCLTISCSQLYQSSSLVHGLPRLDRVPPEREVPILADRSRGRTRACTPDLAGARTIGVTLASNSATIGSALPLHYGASHRRGHRPIHVLPISL